MNINFQCIIILIILAGVAINLSIGENGIFRRAQYAKEQTNIESAKEILTLAIANIQISKNGKAELIDLNETQDKNSMNYNEDIELEKQVQISDISVLAIIKGKYKFKIDKNLNISYIYSENEEQSEDYIFEPFTMPTLTANECIVEGKEYIVKSSSILSTNTEPYLAFDKVTTSNRDTGTWHAASGVPQWIQIKFPNKIQINKFTLKNRESDVTYESLTIKDFTLQCSNDGKKLDRFTKLHKSIWFISSNNV